MSRVTRNALIFPRSPSFPVLAKTVKKSAISPSVIQIFSPLRIQSSPSRSARVLIEAASDPEPGSVRQKAAIISPVANLGK
jgi:hypothetical protein